MKEKIDVMQYNLKLIKELLGWKTVELADKLGCSRQQINLLETGKSKMTQVQYMAIMYLLHAEYEQGVIDPKKWDFLRFSLLQIKMIKKTEYVPKE